MATDNVVAWWVRALWKVKGLENAPLPLFAAAGARGGAFSSEGVARSGALLAMSAGRGRRGLPLAAAVATRPSEQFLRGKLDRIGIVRCADLPIRDGRNSRCRCHSHSPAPPSAKGVLFVTIEDETGVAQESSGLTSSRSIDGRSCLPR